RSPDAGWAENNRCSAPPSFYVKQGAPWQNSCSASPFSGNLLSRLLRVPRVVRWVHVVDLPGPNAVDLDHRGAFKPGGVFHSSRPEAECAGRQSFGCAAIKLLARRQEHGPGNDSHAFGLGMRVRRDVIAVWQL